ncbi:MULTISPECIES: hypothetical protein [unclassified Amycolatopsis]|uniref:hypothetical protein n=1 Tax=unclassified Amycolatopsis TaxID=2618356 RepID=UPI0028766B86|nr:MULTISPECIES: hypothetical protein [unclassified Amycolatopsis]MDS0132845.1 hypothetical protein [Amycolatopsis sp. 505]MDS0142330.1 hypothetical protein [Amycolatopsis sp. CM201R]
MSTRQGPTPKTEDKTPQEVQNMAPAERDAYLQKKAEEGVDPGSWLFGPVQQWIAQAQAKNQSQQMGDKNVADATKGRDVEYVSGLNAPNADYKGTDHTQLQAFLQSNLNVDQVSEVSTAYHQVHQVFDKFAQSMNTAVNASKGTWEGSAAENAQQYFTSLGKWSDANSQNAKLASETIYDQGQAAATAKNSMPAPIPFSWKDEFKGWATSNPFNLADNVDKSIQKQKDSQAAHDEAAGVMATYDKNLYEAASKQPAFAPPPSFSTGGGSDDPNGTGDKNGINNPSSVNMPGGNSGTTPGGHAQGFSSGPVPGMGGSAAHISGPGSTTGAGLLPAGTTTPSGFTPGLAPAASTQNPNQQFGGMPPMSPMPMGGMNFGGDEAYNSKVGGGGGRGSGGFGPGGSGAAGGNATGAGAASGAARPGGIGAAEAAAGRGMGGLGAGAAGRGGGMGPGGGLGRGQKGEGDEDTEHSRPTYLVEGDPDEVFGTDMRTAPPVIGE